MNTKEKKTKKPIEPEKIVKVIQYLPLAVAAIFLIINGLLLKPLLYYT